MWCLHHCLTCSWEPPNVPLFWYNRFCSGAWSRLHNLLRFLQSFFFFFNEYFFYFNSLKPDCESPLHSSQHLLERMSEWHSCQKAKIQCCKLELRVYTYQGYHKGHWNALHASATETTIVTWRTGEFLYRLFVNPMILLLNWRSTPEFATTWPAFNINICTRCLSGCGSM